MSCRNALPALYRLLLSLFYPSRPLTITIPGEFAYILAYKWTFFESDHNFPRPYTRNRWKIAMHFLLLVVAEASSVVWGFPVNDMDNLKFEITMALIQKSDSFWSKWDLLFPIRSDDTPLSANWLSCYKTHVCDFLNVQKQGKLSAIRNSDLLFSCFDSF